MLKKQKKQTSSSNSFFIVAIIAVALVIGYYIIRENVTSLTSNMMPPTPSGSITSDQDILHAYQDVDSSNVDGTIDSQLNNISSDSQNF